MAEPTKAEILEEFVNDNEIPLNDVFEVWFQNVVNKRNTTTLLGTTFYKEMHNRKYHESNKFALYLLRKVLL